MIISKTDTAGVVPENFLLGSVLASLNGAEYVVCALSLHETEVESGFGPACLYVRFTEKERFIEKATWGRKPDDVEKLEELYSEELRHDMAAYFAKHGPESAIDESSLTLKINLISSGTNAPKFYRNLKQVAVISDYFPEVEENLDKARSTLAIGSSITVKVQGKLVERYVASQNFQINLGDDHRMKIEPYAHLEASDYFSSPYFVRLHEESITSGRGYLNEFGYTTSSEFKGEPAPMRMANRMRKAQIQKVLSQ